MDRPQLRRMRNPSLKQVQNNSGVASWNGRAANGRRNGGRDRSRSVRFLLPRMRTAGRGRFGAGGRARPIRSAVRPVRPVRPACGRKSWPGWKRCCSSRTEALSIRKLVQAATLADAAEARRLLEELNDFYDADGSPFRIERVATGYQLLTRPPYSPWLDKLHERQNELKLSSPAMETLTIVAYRQPITRADIEAVRGVQCAEMLKQLMERGLVRICGEEDSLGRPYLYDTTKKFLELFGMRSLDDLPMANTLRRKPQAPFDAAEAEQVDAESPAEAEPESDPAAESEDAAA